MLSELTTAVPYDGAVPIVRVYGEGIESFATTFIILLPPFVIPVTLSFVNTGKESI